MVPSQVLIVDRLPLLGTGKTDYAALPALLAAFTAPMSDEPRSEADG